MTLNARFTHVTRQLQVKRRTGKFAGETPTFHRCTTQPTTNRKMPYFIVCILFA